MRPLTFEGFLRSYVRYLSGEGTLALTRLADRLDSEPRLVEPLLLWAAVSDTAPRLQDLLAERGRTTHAAELALLADLNRNGGLERALEDEDPQLRPEYAKAWRSYAARRDRGRRDERLKLLARQRALDLAAKKGVTRYRMAKDLRLNPGNLHAFLSHGDAKKLGLEKAKMLVKYLEAA